MKAFIKNDFKTLFSEGSNCNVEYYFSQNDANISIFKKDDEVEILKIIDNSNYTNGKAYVIYNKINNESITIDGDWLYFK